MMHSYVRLAYPYRRLIFKVASLQNFPAFELEVFELVTVGASSVCVWEDGGKELGFPVRLL